MMNESEEKAYTTGARMAWRRIMETALRELGYDNGDRKADELISEREQAISILRSLCAEFGDNNWDENLHLADIIDKHLGKHLHAKHSQS